MVRHVRFALLIGALTAMAVSPAARANHGSCNSCNTPCASPCASAPAAAPQASAQPCTRTIQVTECVPETYTVKRTAYKTECRQEEYTCYKTEMCPETRTRQVTCYKVVPETRTECRKVAKTVTVMETRCVNKVTWKEVQETVNVKRLVRCGHWETRQECVPDTWANLCNKVGSMGAGRGHGHHGCNNSCDPCATTCCSAPACPPAPAYKTVCRKHWVHCPEYECCPKTVCKKVRCCEQVTCQVPVCKTVCEDVQVTVCCNRCVPETRTETYTCNVCRQVAVKGTRTVRVCVPYEETVTCTRMVRRTVCREVPVETCAPAAPACNDTCTPCCNSGSSFGSRLRGLLSGPGCGCSSRGHGHRSNGDCCR